MEHEKEEQIPAQQPYVPRPAWQVWLARLGVVIMIIAFAVYCYQIATGGL